MTYSQARIALRYDFGSLRVFVTKHLRRARTRMMLEAHKVVVSTDGDDRTSTHYSVLVECQISITGP